VWVPFCAVFLAFSPGVISGVHWLLYGRQELLEQPGGCSCCSPLQTPIPEPDSFCKTRIFAGIRFSINGCAKAKLTGKIRGAMNVHPRPLRAWAGGQVTGQKRRMRGHITSRHLPASQDAKATPADKPRTQKRAKNCSPRGRLGPHASPAQRQPRARARRRAAAGPPPAPAPDVTARPPRRSLPGRLRWCA
jgi:hypothetical protein